MANTSTINSYNNKINSKLISKYPYLQLGFFHGDILFIGQNPGMPFNIQTSKDTKNMREGTLTYEELIKKSKMGIFLDKVMNNWDDISFTNIVKIPTMDNAEPSQEMIDEFMPITLKQIELLKPKTVVCLGKFSSRQFGLENIWDMKKIDDIKFISFPHPSYLDRTKEKKEYINELRWRLFQHKLLNHWDFDGVIYLMARVDGKKVIRKIEGFKWYCFINKNGEYIKVYDIKPDNIETYEADFSLSQRFCIDNNIKLEEDLKILFFDIETDDRINTIEIGRDRILSWAAIDPDRNIYYNGHEKEKNVLLNIKEVFQNYDIICGWNSSKFDLPYIKERFKKNGIYYNFKENLHVDLMKRYIKLFAPGMTLMGLKSFSLNDMSKTFLNEEKISFSGSIWNLYKKDPVKFKKYNIQDVELLRKLNEKMKTLELMIKEASITNTRMDRFFIGNLLDNYIITEAYKRGEHVVSKPDEKESYARKNIVVRGAYVMSPKKGYYDNVYIYDFKSLYPSIIVGWNIGSDSLIKGDISKNAENNFNTWLNQRKIEEIDITEWKEFLRTQKNMLDSNNIYIQTANNQFFKRDHISFIGELVENLLEERIIYKKELDKHKIGTAEYNNAKAQQEIVKEMSNSMFGITADKDSRYFDKRVCEGITLTGQFMNKLAASIFQNNDIEVLYGDTDSVFVKLNNENPREIAEQINNELSRELDSFFQLNKNIVYLEYEKRFSKFILMEKKRYCGMLTEMDGNMINKMYYRGIEVIQKSTIEYTRKRLEELFNYIMVENKSEEYIANFIDVLYKETIKKEFDIKDITISQKVNKPINSYKTSLPHMRLARKLIEQGKMLDIIEEKHSWSQIKYVITSFKRKEEILIEDYNGDFDRDYYWRVKIFAPMQRVLRIVFPTNNWPIYPNKQLTLF